MIFLLALKPGTCPVLRLRASRGQSGSVRKRPLDVLCIKKKIASSRPRKGSAVLPFSKREPEREEQTEENMPPKFKRHLNDDEVTGSVRSERRNLLEEDSDEEEDFFLRGPTGPKFGPKNDKIRQVQNQVDEVIDVMQENISKVIERGERLDDLQDKSESLSDNASAFSSRAKQLHRRMWWRDTKMKAIIALVIVVLLLIIISECPSGPDTCVTVAAQTHSVISSPSAGIKLTNVSFFPPPSLVPIILRYH
uniref:Vesicle-associated membrane protein 4 n=2 Tax=Paramormyrops kingsleyae TaxID=1676925 RepID=A0A3B3S9D5_9TELE